MAKQTEAEIWFNSATKEDLNKMVSMLEDGTVTADAFYNEYGFSHSTGYTRLKNMGYEIKTKGKGKSSNAEDDSIVVYLYDRPRTDKKQIKMTLSTDTIDKINSVLGNVASTNDKQKIMDELLYRAFNEFDNMKKEGKIVVVKAPKKDEQRIEL